MGEGDTAQVVTCLPSNLELKHHHYKGTEVLKKKKKIHVLT
jgi:hypothetical protein